MNKIRAKFKVDSKKETITSKYNDGKLEPCKLVTIEMTPVSCTHQKNEKGEWVITQSENTRFWEASPSGKLDLGCINLDAANAFELGKEYYIDFIQAV